MLVVAFVRIRPESTVAEMLTASRSLRDAGVAGVGFLDAQDLGAPVGAVESSSLATLVALGTPGLGIIASQSALFGYPFHTARRLSTLDHLSAGFSGWLLRTGASGAEAQAYDWRSDGVPDHDLARAAEHAEICFRLWDSWEDGAQWPDKDSGDFKDDSRIHPIGYSTDRFQVEGPLDVPPSPQRRPVVFAEVTSAAQAAALASWTDVAVVRARDTAAATALAEAIGARRDIARILIGCGADGLSLGDATHLAHTLGVDGIAPVIDPGDVGDVAALAGPPVGTPRTLAERLGLDALPVGGRTA